jgi:hypothetical protein
VRNGATTRALLGCTAALVFAVLIADFSRSVTAFQLQADDWTTECDIEARTGDCFIVGVVKGVSSRQTKGSFALAVDLLSGQVAIVGKPEPTRAVIHVGKSTPMECVGNPCLLPSRDAETLIYLLSSEHLLLIDLFSHNEIFALSISTKGYQLGFLKIQAHRDLLR